MKASDWIPVGDWKPRDRRVYLVAVAEKYFTTAIINPSGVWYSAFGRSSPLNVTHWQSIVAPEKTP